MSGETGGESSEIPIRSPGRTPLLWLLELSLQSIFALHLWSPVLGAVSFWASQVALVVKNLPANAGDRRDMDSIPGLGR